MIERIVTLICGHIAPERCSGAFAQLCPRCGMTREIIDRHDGYSVRCLTCRYGKRFGMGQVMAEHAASRHARANPGHKVDVRLGPNRISAVRFSNLPDNLLDVPPF